MVQLAATGCTPPCCKASTAAEFNGCPILLQKENIAAYTYFKKGCQPRSSRPMQFASKGVLVDIKFYSVFSFGFEFLISTNEVLFFFVERQSKLDVNKLLQTCTYSPFLVF